MDASTESTTEPTVCGKTVRDVLNTLPTFKFENPTHPDVIAANAQHRDGQVVVTPTLAALVLVLKAMGLARITPDNVARVVCRIEFYETVFGALRATREGDVVRPNYFTRHEVVRFVGLTLSDTMHLSDELVAGRVYRLFRARRMAAMDAATTTPPAAPQESTSHA